MKSVMVFGTFDRLHLGHEFAIKEAMKRGQVTVIVARATNVKRIKGKHPLESDDDRLCALMKAFPTATILPGDPEDFLAPIRAVKPDLILLGYDQTLPPGVRENDLKCAVERLPSFHPERFKSSLINK